MTAPYVKDVSQYLLTKQRESSKELAGEWAKLEELYNKKLWHQLTFKVLEFVKNPEIAKGDNLIQLYNNFISVFETRINPLSLAEITVYIVAQYKNPTEAVEFLKKIETRVKPHVEAEALCKVLSGRILLEQLNDNAGTKAIIVEIEKVLDDFDGISTVHWRHYLLAAQYYKKLEQHADYYRTALRYLGCVDLEKLSLSEKQEHALYLGLAALLGDKIYNIGELLTHPVLETLKTTSQAWLVELLFAFNAGDIGKFEKMKPMWMMVPDLVSHERKLREKIYLLCLMEMTFKRPSNDRQLTFTEISKEARLPVEEVELLVMKALAQGLVKGSIDQVAQVVSMTWVQPRVLEKPQIQGMVERLNSWVKDVEVMEKMMETKGSDFLTL